MAAKSTKVYPIKGRFLLGVPTTVQVIETKGEAERLIESGAFTDNPRHPDRDPDAPDTSGEPVSFEDNGPADAGPSDSTAKE